MEETMIRDFLLEGGQEITEEFQAQCMLTAKEHLEGKGFTVLNQATEAPVDIEGFSYLRVTSTVTPAG